MNKLEQARANKIQKHTGAGRQTRADDISDDEDDEEDQVIFEPMVVTRTSAEVKVMSKWLNAARKRLGGVFPRPNARTEMEEYAAKMREYKLRKAKADMRARGFISDDEDEDGNIKLKIGHINAASKALAQLWLLRAREVQKQTIIKQRENMKINLRRISGALSEEFDWYFGQELRLTGSSLRDEGDALEEKRRQMVADAKTAARKLEDELSDFILEKEAQMQAEIEQIEERMKEERVKLLEKAELRIQEITKDKTKKAMMFEKETKLAPPESRPRMVKQQKVELKKLDKLIEAERQKQASAIDSAIEAGQEDLGAKQRKREDALQKKKDVVDRKTKQLYDTVDDQMKKSETAWLNRSAGWTHKAERKIKQKQEEDEKKKASTKGKKTRRS